MEILIQITCAIGLIEYMDKKSISGLQAIVMILLIYTAFESKEIAEDRGWEVWVFIVGILASSALTFYNNFIKK